MTPQTFAEAKRVRDAMRTRVKSSQDALHDWIHDLDSTIAGEGNLLGLPPEEFVLKASRYLASQDEKL